MTTYSVHGSWTVYFELWESDISTFEEAKQIAEQAISKGAYHVSIWDEWEGKQIYTF